MIFKNVTPDEVSAIVREVSHQHYGGNLTCEWETYRHAKPTITGNRWRGRIVPLHSDGLGARRSASGRRQRAACWHAFRDVFGAILKAYPQATISTGVLAGLRKADKTFPTAYTASNYHDVFPQTLVNAGSLIHPIRVDQLCDCCDMNPARVLETELPAGLVAAAPEPKPEPEPEDPWRGIRTNDRIEITNPVMPAHKGKLGTVIARRTYGTDNMIAIRFDEGGEGEFFPTSLTKIDKLDPNPDKLRAEYPGAELATCGTCQRSFPDVFPASRCPWEYDH